MSEEGFGIEDLVAANEALQREVATLTIARNDYQRQVAELMKRVRWLEKLRKSGK